MRKSPAGKGQPGILTGSSVQNQPWRSAVTRELCFLLSDARAMLLLITLWLRRKLFRVCLLGLVLVAITALTFAYQHHMCTVKPDRCAKPEPVRPMGEGVEELPPVILVHTAPAAAEAIQSDTCAEALQFSQVAMLFLTLGAIPHEPTWRQWFKDIRGAIPGTAAAAGSCTADFKDRWLQHCQPDPARPDDVIAQQHLFTVYVHPAPAFEGFKPGSIFHGREITTRVEAAWGSHALVVAARELLRAALQDPHNQKFILLSETAVPMYPPTVTYHHLANEAKSRVHACKHGSMDLFRWHPSMGKHERRIPPSRWRKSQQWFAMIRSHAQLMVDDTAFDQTFADTCYSRWDHKRNRWYDCYSDEHFLPVLLTMHGKERETYCSGNLMHVNWAQGGPHPTTYRTSDISADLFQSMRWLGRENNECDVPAALSFAKQAFVSFNNSRQLHDTCARDSSLPNMTHLDLNHDCPLFARKFPEHTAQPMHKFLTDCKHTLDILSCDHNSSADAARVRAHSSMSFFQTHNESE